VTTDNAHLVGRFGKLLREMPDAKIKDAIAQLGVHRHRLREAVLAERGLTLRAFAQEQRAGAVPAPQAAPTKVALKRAKAYAKIVKHLENSPAHTETEVCARLGWPRGYVSRVLREHGTTLRMLRDQIYEARRAKRAEHTDSKA